MAQRDDTLIPTSFLGLDIPTQRWYALSFGALLQVRVMLDNMRLLILICRPLKLQTLLLQRSQAFCLLQQRLRHPMCITSGSGLCWMLYIFLACRVYDFRN
jgi:hypothetical protein